MEEVWMRIEGEENGRSSVYESGGGGKWKQCV